MRWVSGNIRLISHPEGIETVGTKVFFQVSVNNPAFWLSQCGEMTSDGCWLFAGVDALAQVDHDALVFHRRGAGAGAA